MREYEQFGRRVEQESAQARVESDLEYQWDRDAAQSHDELYGTEYPYEFRPPVEEKSFGPDYFVDENHDEVGDIPF